VTSNDAGLSVPDWPTTFGSLYKLPPMVGGVKFEHGHRVVAEFIGLMTIIMAIWTWRVERRSWVRKLAVSAIGVVIAQGILGGLTVLYFLPPAVSTAHATLGQTFFCIMVALAVVTSREWLETSTMPENNKPKLNGLATLATAAVYVQLILGAGFRHSGIKLLPHLISAVFVTIVLLWTILRVLTHYAGVPALRRSAAFLLVLLMVQLSLGFASYLTRVQWGRSAVQPELPMVISTVAHVAVGALLLATTLVLTMQCRRYATSEVQERVSSAAQARRIVAA